MIKLIIENIDDYNYTLKDNNNNSYNRPVRQGY